MNGLIALLGDDRPALTRAMLLAGAAGLGRACMLPLVNWGIHDATRGGLIIGGLCAVALLVLTSLAHQRSARQLGRIATDAISRRTLALTEAVRRASLTDVERERDALGQVSRDLADLTVLPQQLQSKASAAPEMLGHGLYALALSPAGFVVWLVGTALLNRALQHTRSAKFAGLQAVDARWRVFDRRLSAFLDVFARLRLNRAAMRSAVDDVLTARAETRAAVQAVDEVLRRSRVRSTVLPTLFIGTLIVVVEGVVGLGGAVAVQFGTIVLMARGPMSSLMAIDPLLEVERALQSLDALQARLGDGDGLPLPGAPSAGFDRLELRGVTYRFEGGFQLGPVDLCIARGELVLVVGHNGSGKTTLMKLLSGLYRPLGGSIRVDGERVSPARLRQLFTVTLIDAHLFDRAYGLRVDDAQIEDRLAALGIDDVVGVVDGRFSSVALSSGQGRRLALAIALMEERPVLVLDEWDAHQDPLTTRYYFETLLPRLAAEGRTVIAVCHDDRFFGVGDRVITLAGGRLVPGPDGPTPPGADRSSDA